MACRPNRRGAAEAALCKGKTHCGARSGSMCGPPRKASQLWKGTLLCFMTRTFANVNWFIGTCDGSPTSAETVRVKYDHGLRWHRLMNLPVNLAVRCSLHGKKDFVILTKSFVKGIAKIFCYYNKIFSSINKTFGCCSKIFVCSNKNFICP